MPASVSQSSTQFSFLPAASSSSADGTRNDSGNGFAQMLQGQMSARANQQTNRASYPSHTENTARSNQAQRTREPQRETARTPERAQQAERPEKPDTEHGADSREGSIAPQPATSTDSTTTQPAAAAPSQPADPQQAAAQPADGAAIAGLPAAIAALLAGTAKPENTAPAEGAELGLGLQAGDGADDTLAKSLQNPAGAAANSLAGDADAANKAAQLAAQLQPKTESAGNAERPASGLQVQTTDMSNGLHMAAATTGSRHPSATQNTVPQLPVNTPANQAAFADDVGDRVMWMLGRAESKAELVLTPPTLGKVEVSINLSGDQTTAQFVASSQAARDALEQAMPKLREILQQAGISLGQTSVGTSGEQSAGQDDGSRRGGTAGRGGIESGESAGASKWIRQSEGMVDTFV